MDLRCRKTSCKYNKNLTCSSKNIDISNKLKCEMFEHKEGKTPKDYSTKIFSDTPLVVANYRHLNDMCLKCKANCLFNDEGHCKSNGITVNDSTRGAICITFLKP